MFRVILVGSVTSSLVTLKSLIENNINVIGVLGYEPESEENVSGYANMSLICEAHKIPYFPFIKINDEKNISLIKSLSPDILFVVGLSQLVSHEILSISKMGNIGFHPTLLPRGRGRAPIAWLILEEKYGAANFFLMGEGADDGPVFIQEPFPVTEKDDASTVEEKILSAIKTALNKWLPALKDGEWNPVPQNELFATYYAKRSPDDGLINWNNSSEEIDKLLRASTKPHPGAYSFLKNKKIRIWSSKKEKMLQIRGVTGRVLLVNNNKYLIQCGTGLLWISSIKDESNNPIKLKIGQKLGYQIEDEIWKLKNEIESIKKCIQQKTF
jgi:methionyl-tRNA formyltransferase